METSTHTKVEIMKPVFLKAGIPLAVTVAGYVFARLVTRKGSNRVASSSVENQANSPGGDPHEQHRDEGSSLVLESFDLSSSSSSCCVQDSHCLTEEAPHQNSEVILIDDHHKEDLLEDAVSCLRNRVQDLQERELELEARFLRYNDMKDQELLLMELRNKLSLEITKVEFLDREILLVEAERHRFEDMVVEYLKIMQLLETSKSENSLLRRRVKKLLRRSKEQTCVIKEQCLHIEANETEISRNSEELAKRVNDIKKMEEEIEQLKTAMGRKQIENDELLNELELANKAASSKMKAEEATAADYGMIVSKLEKLEKERADEVKELIYLRWCNACLRHELLRRNQEDQDQRQQAETSQMDLQFGEIAHLGSDNELDCSSFGHDDSCLGFPANGHAHSRRRKFIEKLKKWMEGSEKTKQKFGRHFVHSSAGDLHLPARKSCSSA